ncbi:MFS transporter [Glaciibacter superstes]|uniref:MFS transporter n=1 Tax=Glaciibacter superstes TaxID=501023 RepID=UPI001FDEB606|nr:MFS transporter [Glaciibacter superstes]
MTVDNREVTKTTDAGTGQAEADEPGGVLSVRYRWISIGMCALILLSAFESLAVTTIMPSVSAELDGQSLYALAFAGPLAVSVVGMVLAGNWADRRGPRAPLYAAVALFIVGLLVAGTAPSMELLVTGRLIHGFGGGALTVALYVIVARVYPARLQPSIFAGFAAAWVIPSLVGPFVAGVVADTVGWPWVFLGVVLLVVPALFMVVPAMRGLSDSPQTDAAPWSTARIAWSALAAVAVLVLNLSAGAGDLLRWVLPFVAIIALAFALRPLLPVGTLRAAFGLPSVVLLRGLIAGSFFAAEIYVPYLLTAEYGLTASMAGLALTLGGLAWASASWVQGRFSDRLDHRACLRIGLLLLGFALTVVLVGAMLGMAAVLLIIGWGFAGAGMGLMYPRTSVMALQSSTQLNQGFVSSAISISDAIGSAVAIALTGIVFTALVPMGGVWPFVGCFALAVALWLLGGGASLRASVSVPGAGASTAASVA